MTCRCGSHKNSPKAIFSPVLLFSLGAFLVLHSVPIRSEAENLVGIYYYLWYGNADGTGGLGTRHWNTSGCIVKDPPIQGFYSSFNATLIEWHIHKLAALEIDFVLISWWGPFSFEDNATKKFIEVNQNLGWPLKFALLVEPYEDPFNYTEAFNYIGPTYITPYSDNYVKWDGRPLLLFFNPLQPPASSAFNSKIIGHTVMCDWIMGSISNSTYTYPPELDNEGERLSADGHCSAQGRGDDYYLWLAGYRQECKRFDVNLTEGLYDRQWLFVLAHEVEGKIRIATIISWNEYHDRSQVEPCDDFTAEVDPYFLYEKTQKFVKSFHRHEAFVLDETGIAKAVWDNKELNITFSVPADIEVFCSIHGQPQHIENGLLVQYNSTTKVAKIKVSASQVLVSWLPQESEPDFLLWGGIIGVGSAFAYLVFRRRKKTSQRG